MNALLLLVLTVGNASPADALREAAERFNRGDDAGAVEAYETALAAGADGVDVYFNLGSCALRTGDLGRAGWALREARARDPWDEDVRFNLDLVTRANADTVVGQEQAAWREAMELVPRAPLQWGALAAWWLACVLAVARGVVGRRVLLERLTVAIAAMAVVAGAVALVVERTAGAPSAVVMPREVVVRASDRPDGPEAFRVHAGLAVRPLEAPAGGMLRIRLANGLEGWIEEGAVRHVRGPGASDHP